MNYNHIHYFKREMSRGLESYNIPKDLLGDHKPVIVVENEESADALYQLIKQYSFGVELYTSLEDLDSKDMVMKRARHIASHHAEKTTDTQEPLILRGV